MKRLILSPWQLIALAICTLLSSALVTVFAGHGIMPFGMFIIVIFTHDVSPSEMIWYFSYALVAIFIIGSLGIILILLRRMMILGFHVGRDPCCHCYNRNDVSHCVVHKSWRE